MTTITDARDQLAELEERVRDGDTSVTAAMLAKARDAAQFSALAEEADRRKAASEAEAARVERIRTIYASLTDGELRDRAAAVVAAFDAAIAATSRLAEVAATFDNTVAAAGRELAQLGEIPEDVPLVVRAPGYTAPTIAFDGRSLTSSPRWPRELVVDSVRPVFAGQHWGDLRTLASMPGADTISSLRAWVSQPVDDDLAGLDDA